MSDGEQFLLQTVVSKEALNNKESQLFRLLPIQEYEELVRLRGSGPATQRPPDTNLKKAPRGKKQKLSTAVVDSINNTEPKKTKREVLKMHFDGFFSKYLTPDKDSHVLLSRLVELVVAYRKECPRVESTPQTGPQVEGNPSTEAEIVKELQSFVASTFRESKIMKIPSAGKKIGLVGFRERLL